MLDHCRKVVYQDTNSSTGKKEKGSKKAKRGVINVNMEIQNVIQLLELTTLCTEGKSEIAEIKSRMSILSFGAAVRLLKMSEQFFPLKKAILNYITHCCLDSNDPTFLKKPNKEEDEPP